MNSLECWHLCAARRAISSPEVQHKRFVQSQNLIEGNFVAAQGIVSLIHVKFEIGTAARRVHRHKERVSNEDDQANGRRAKYHGHILLNSALIL